MKSITKHIASFLVLALCFPIIVPAEDLPSLPAASNIRAGSLPNGVNYYIVQNSSHKGMADIALVQKVGKADEEPRQKGSVTVAARAALTDLPHFSHNSPFGYLNGKSILPSSTGFVRAGEEATIYRFENLVQARKADIVDSTLLLVFDIISRGNEKMDKMYAPENQAIIVSGDIEPDAIRGKMDILSMFIPKKSSSPKERPYEWRPSDKAEAELLPACGKVGVYAEYSSPRSAAEDMATVLPLVSSRYAKELEIALRRRLGTVLEKERIPYASIDFSYTGSGDTPYDEKVRMGIRTTEAYLEKAAASLASVLSSLDANGVTENEFRAAENEFRLNMADRYGIDLVTNASCVDKCISAFLYGSSLASDKTNSAFFSRRDMDITTSTMLFNNFVSALLDRDRNLRLEFRTDNPEADAQALASAFRNAWGSFGKDAERCFMADTSMLKKSSGKAKIRQEMPEPLTGGQTWTFTNGIRVIFKQVGNDGHFSYSWLVKGGYSYMQDIRPGESAYLGDLIGTFRKGGLSGREFNDMLNSNGISLETTVSISDLTISGSALSPKFPLLVKSLISLAYDREEDKAAFGFLRDRIALGLMEDDPVQARLDSLMNRDMKMSGYRRKLALEDDFQRRAARYYDDCFSRMNDGVLIIVGDLDPEQTKKTLTQYLGAFRTDKAYAYRSRGAENRIRSRSTMVRTADKPALGVELSAAFNYTAENFMAANIAAIFMEDAVAKAAAKDGWILDARSSILMFPEESLVMDFLLERADPDGLPASMVCETSARTVLAHIREAISRAGAAGIDEDELKIGKSILSNLYKSWSDDPKTLTRLLVLRYSYGKDLLSDYAGKISSVTVRSVNPIMASLSRDGIAEYVQQMKDVPDFTEIPPADSPLPVVAPLRPAEGSFYYPYDGSTVPLDSLDLKDLVDLPVLYLPCDNCPDSSALNLPDSLSAKDSLSLGRILSGEDGLPADDIPNQGSNPDAEKEGRSGEGISLREMTDSSSTGRRIRVMSVDSLDIIQAVPKEEEPFETEEHND